MPEGYAVLMSNDSFYAFTVTNTGDLSLFTCTYGGQTRLTLRCVEQG